MPDLKRSPFYSDIVISVGGYSFQVWKESTQSHPVVQSTYGTNSLTVAEWSTIRPGVFFVGRQDGVLEVWDLMEQSHMPTALHSVSANAIASISIIGQQSSGGIMNQGGGGLSTITYTADPRRLLYSFEEPPAPVCGSGRRRGYPIRARSVFGASPTAEE